MNTLVMSSVAALAAASTGSTASTAPAVSTVATGQQIDSIWLLLATILALLMAPGVAFFYGGLVRATGVVNMMMMSFGAIAIVGVLWVLYGYGMVFGTAWLPHVWGDPFSDMAFGKLIDSPGGPDMYSLAVAGFHAAFAIDVVALISGAIADRARFGSWLVFAGVWVTVVYFPVARWVFNAHDGWAVLAGVHDFAGGIAVHINAGAAALAVVLVLGPRHGFRRGMDEPHNVPLTLVGAALLWIGWFGFNAGSEGGVDGVTMLASINTLIAPCAAILGWAMVERVREGRVSSVGAVSGLVVGLVASAPACDVLSPGWMLVLGLISGVVCAFLVDLRFTLGFDDSLNVVGIHLVGGLVGTLFVGIAGRGMGLVETGSWHQLGVQAGIALVVMLYSFGASWAIAAGIQRIIGFRVAEHEEKAGLDGLFHGERGYAMVPVGVRPTPDLQQMQRVADPAV